MRKREGSSPVQSVCRYSPSVSISLVRPTQCVQLDPLQLNAGGGREGGRERGRGREGGPNMKKGIGCHHTQNEVERDSQIC